MSDISYKYFLAFLGTLAGFAGYVPYIRDVFFRRTTKPHFFSWFLWGILESIAFAAAVSGGAGPGALVLLFTAIFCFAIAIKAFFERRALSVPWKIAVLDWVALALSIVAIALWILTDIPVTAIIIVSAADFIAFIPTFRKTWQFPAEETLFEFGASAVKQIFIIAALRSYNLTTWLYPASLILTNSSFVGMALLRRRHAKRLKMPENNISGKM